MSLNKRWLRKTLRHILPEPVKRHFRARLFGYTPAVPPADWSVEAKGENASVRLGTVTAEFPAAVRDSLRYHCVENGDSVEELQGFLEHARRNPGTLFDVGAADGLFATVFCQARPENQAIAFEPAVELCPHIESCVRLNGLAGRLTLVQSAVGRVSGAATGTLNQAGMLILTEGEVSGPTVRVISLDEYAAAHGPPTAVKIDVEGYEGEVLRGASSLLNTHRPILFLEFHLDILEQNGERVEDLLALLTTVGYRFETSKGMPLSLQALRGSPNAIIRFIARADV